MQRSLEKYWKKMRAQNPGTFITIGEWTGNKVPMPSRLVRRLVRRKSKYHPDGTRRKNK